MLVDQTRDERLRRILGSEVTAQGREEDGLLGGEMGDQLARPEIGDLGRPRRRCARGRDRCQPVRAGRGGAAGRPARARADGRGRAVSGPGVVVNPWAGDAMVPTHGRRRLPGARPDVHVEDPRGRRAPRRRRRRDAGRRGVRRRRAWRPRRPDRSAPSRRHGGARAARPRPRRRPPRARSGSSATSSSTSCRPRAHSGAARFWPKASSPPSYRDCSRSDPVDALHATVLYGHPILGGVTIALAAWTGALGLRSRLPLRRAPALRVAHARLAPWVLALAVASWPCGATTTWWLRDDLESGGELAFPHRHRHRLAVRRCRDPVAAPRSRPVGPASSIRGSAPSPCCSVAYRCSWACRSCRTERRRWRPSELGVRSDRIRQAQTGIGRRCTDRRRGTGRSCRSGSRRGRRS